MTSLSNAMQTGDWTGIPSYAMAMTFDDGWKENVALIDTIVRYELRPMIFLTSGIINTSRNFWWTLCSRAEVNRMKKLPNHQRLEVLQKQYTYDPEKEYPETRQALNASEINQLKEVVDFGCHSRYHPFLPKCTRAEKRSEIAVGKQDLERMLEQPIEFFAYPNGDYDEESIELLKEFGFNTARTIDAGWTGRKSDPYKLKVTGVSDDGTLNKLASELTGFPLYMQYFFKWSFLGKKEKI